MKSINQGWHWDGFLLGLARVTFSFYAGVAVSRAQPFLPNVRLPAGMLLVGITLILCMPLGNLGGRSFALASVLVIFPIVLHLGAGAYERDPRLGQILGDLSYAVYAVHWPIVVLAAYVYVPWARAAVMPLPSLQLELIIAGVVSLLALGLHHWFDKPVRAWLATILATSTKRVQRTAETPPS